MRISEILLESEQPDVAYHITTESNASEIMKHGLDPRNDSSHEFYGDERRVYLITNTNNINEVRGWIEATLEDEGNTDEPLTILKVDVTGLPLKYGNGFYYSTDNIPPNRITDLGWRELQRY